MSETFVLLHGSPGDPSSFDPLVALAPPGARCLTWEVLDHGSSLAPESTLDDAVSDVVDRVRALDTRVTLIGHSFGAWLAGRALAALGDQVGRFVSIAGFAGASPELAARGPGFAAALESGALPLSAASGVAADLWLPSVGRDPLHVARVAQLIEGHDVVHLARVLRRHGELAAPAQRVASYSTPACILQAREDRATPLSLAHELADLGEHAEVITFPDDSHFLHWTRTEEVAAIIFSDPSR